MTTNVAPEASLAGPEPGAIILMVSAQQARREVLAKILTAQGHRVLFPPSAAEAIARVQNAHLLIVQTAAVGDEEFNLLASLRESENAWQIPVMMVADDASLGAVGRALELGAVEVLTWPVDAIRLLSRVQACVWHKQRREEEALDFKLAVQAKEEAEQLVSSLIPLGVSMVKEKDSLRLMELILTEGMRLTDCEGGTIYMRGLDHTLNFLLVRNDMLDINMGGSTGKPITFPPLRLFNDQNQPNHQYVANHAALSSQTVNIEDAYSAGRFDFSGTRKFDASTGYRSKSFLTVPLKNERQQVIGVLQLINARDPKTGVITRFDSAIQPTIEAFAVLAAAILDAYRTAQLGSDKV
jgi:DNA-binding response OmpR family regulator